MEISTLSERVKQRMIELGNLSEEDVVKRMKEIDPDVRISQPSFHKIKTGETLNPGCILVLSQALECDGLWLSKNKRVLSAKQKAAAVNLRRIWDAKKKGLNLTQESAANTCGWLSQGTVNQYLNAKIGLNVDAILKFAALLSVSPYEISHEIISELGDFTIKIQGQKDVVNEPVREYLLHGQDRAVQSEDGKILAKINSLDDRKRKELGRFIDFMIQDK